MHGTCQGRNEHSRRYLAGSWVLPKDLCSVFFMSAAGGSSSAAVTSCL